MSALEPTTSSGRTIKRKDYRTRTRLWGLCMACRWRWSWSGETRYVTSGLDMIKTSACRCNWGQS